MSVNSADLHLRWNSPAGGYQNAFGDPVNIEAYKFNMDGIEFVIPLSDVTSGTDGKLNATIQNIEVYEGDHTGKIAPSRNANGTRLGPYSNLINLTVQYYNVAPSFIATQVGNDVRLDWTYPVNNWTFDTGNNVSFKFKREWTYDNSVYEGAYNVAAGIITAGPYHEELNSGFDANRNDWYSWAGTSGFASSQSSWVWTNGVSGGLPVGGYLLRDTDDLPVPIAQDFVRQPVTLRPEHTLNFYIDVKLPNIQGGDSVYADLCLFNGSTTTVISSTQLFESQIVSINEYDVTSNYDFVGFRFRYAGSNDVDVYVDKANYEIFAPFTDYGTAAQAWDYGVGGLDMESGTAGTAVKYSIAAYDTDALNTYKYSNTSTVYVTNYNIPLNLTVQYGTNGNNADLYWTNPAYSKSIQSFSISRINPAGHPDGFTTLFTFNNNGSATHYVNLNVGLYPGTYGYQISAAEELNGFGILGYTSPVYVNVFNNTPPGESVPKVYFTGNYNLTKYYGSYIIAPELAVNASTSGSGTMNFVWQDQLNSSFTENNNQNINYSSNNFTLNLNGKSRSRADAINYTWDSYAVEGLTYDVGGTSQNISIALPEKTAPVLLSVDVTGDNHEIKWTRLTEDAIRQGYWLTFYPEGNPVAFENYLINDAASSGTASFIKYGAGTAGYNTTYMTRGASNSTYTTDYMSELSNSITSSSADTPPSAPTASCPSSQTTTSATLTWSNTGADGYKVLIRIWADNTVIYNNFDVGNVISYNFALDPLDGYLYKYKVIAYNGAGESDYGNEITFGILPPAPTNFSSTSHTSSSVALNWDDVSGIGNYQAQRALTSDFASPTNFPTNIVNSNVTWTSLSSGTTYYFRVRSQFSSGSCGSVVSAWSSTVTQATS